ncbi:Imm1 family immunity protein [Bradyrhizobium sp. cir1]|uniref:Imm1 family immunity protein n=1 Tax=Bradyrhizobium sp. cir1 TaxID=1445730 RepID=UPI0039082B36
MEHNKPAIGPIREISWEPLAETSGSISNPSWRDVEDKIRRLETVQSGSVFLSARNGSVLSIGGERDKGYLVFISNTEESKYLQAPPSRRKGAQNLVIGFQPGEYPCRIIVDLDVALKVARMYFDTGRVADNGDWTSDCNSIEE